MIINVTRHDPMIRTTLIFDGAGNRWRLTDLENGFSLSLVDAAFPATGGQIEVLPRTQNSVVVRHHHEPAEPRVAEREDQTPEQHQAELDAWGATP